MFNRRRRPFLRSLAEEGYDGFHVSKPRYMVLGTFIPAFRLNAHGL
jgi:hypothetical protein